MKQEQLEKLTKILIDSNELIDDNEQIKVILGESYLKNFIEKGTIKQSFAILTDRRIYMRGK